MRRLTVLLLGFLLAGCSRGATVTDAAFSSTGRVVAMSGGDGGAAHACFTCHGLDGAGDGDAAPRLAGLDSGYLHKQLEDYVAGLRKDPTMAAVAKGLSPRARQAVADYYAGLPAPRAMSAGPAPAAYEGCVGCHGANGEGVGAAGPAIAGQPAVYVADQLRKWRQGARRNDPRGVMQIASAGLSDAEIAALAAWLAAQSAARAPASAVATGSPSDAAWEAPAASRA